MDAMYAISTSVLGILRKGNSKKRELKRKNVPHKKKIPVEFGKK